MSEFWSIPSSTIAFLVAIDLRLVRIHNRLHQGFPVSTSDAGYWRPVLSELVPHLVSTLILYFRLPLTPLADMAPQFLF